MRFTMLLWLLLNAAFACAQQSFTVAELNAENLFDCQHDEGKNDKDFLPEGGRKWTPLRLKEKLRNISKTLMSMGNMAPPDIIALIEVENDSVLKKLTRHTLLRKARYQYILAEGNDPRGIDVALLYMPETFKLISHKAIKPIGKDRQPIATRSILHTKGRIITGDTLHLFVCHLSSKLRGRQAMHHRRSEARCLRQAVDSLQTNGAKHIIIIGDFNDTPLSPVMTSALAVEQKNYKQQTTADKLYNLAERMPISARNRFGGTYKYDGKWEMLDQCIVTGKLLDATSDFFTSYDRFQVWSPDFLLEKDPEDLGLRPRRTYTGYRYQGGYSDHLPIVARFSIKWKW